MPNNSDPNRTVSQSERRQAEEALLKAGALQKAIFNSANFSSIATDAQGVIQIFNVGAERMLGYTAAQVIFNVGITCARQPSSHLSLHPPKGSKVGRKFTLGRQLIMKKIGIIVGGGILLVVVLFGWWIINRPERGTTGSVSTRFRWLGPNDKIVIDSFNDPKVQGVACYIARAQTGGVKGGLGLAEDTSDASISCRQVGPIKILGELKDGESVFDEHRSLVFKKLQVVRFLDRERNVLVYVAYSDRVIEGSPQNSISVVPIMGWPAP